jgi:hypothetical protein
MSRKTKTTFSLFAAITIVALSGCVGDDSGISVLDTTQEENYRNGSIETIPIDSIDTFAVIREHEGTVKILVEEAEGSPYPTERQLFIRFIDAGGNIKDVVETVPPLEPGSLATQEISINKMPTPIIVLTQCGCVMAWIVNGDNLIAEQGNPDLLRVTEKEIHVEYGSSTNAISGDPLYDEETFSFNKTVAHWFFVWEHNMNAEATLLAPDGSELGAWEANGRSTQNGHISEGAKPLKDGDWTLTLQGYGWFTLFLKQSEFTTNTWESLGIIQPSENQK